MREGGDRGKGGEGKKETLPWRGCGFSAEGCRNQRMLQGRPASWDVHGRAGIKVTRLLGEAASRPSHHVERDACGDHHQLIDDFFVSFFFNPTQAAGLT